MPSRLRISSMVGVRRTTLRKANSTASFLVLRLFCFITVSTSSSSMSMLVRVIHQAYTSGRQAEQGRHRDGDQEHHQQPPSQQQGDHPGGHSRECAPVHRVRAALIEELNGYQGRQHG